MQGDMFMGGDVMRIEDEVTVALMLTTARRTLLAGLSVVVLASCTCVGNGCEESPADPNALHLSINQPTRDSTYTTAEDSVSLEGSVDAGDVSWTRDGGMTTPAFMFGGFWYVCWIDGWPYTCYYPLTWSASVPLHLGTNVITVTAQDLSGNRGQVTIIVTRPSDVTSPTVSSTGPQNGVSGVGVNASINAKFSEPMDGTTITPETFSLVDSNGNSVVGTVTMDGDSSTFHPSALLAGLTTHAATVTTGVKDLAGNAMAAPRTWTFTTAVAPDTTPPSVISTSPSSGSTCIGIDSTISLAMPHRQTTVGASRSPRLGLANGKRRQRLARRAQLINIPRYGPAR